MMAATCPEYCVTTFDSTRHGHVYRKNSSHAVHMRVPTQDSAVSPKLATSQGGSYCFLSLTFDLSHSWNAEVKSIKQRATALVNAPYQELDGEVQATHCYPTDGGIPHPHSRWHRPFILENPARNPGRKHRNGAWGSVSNIAAIAEARDLPFRVL